MKRAALALLLLGCAAARAEEEDWAASKGSAAEAQLHKQLKAAVRTIPGTETQYFIGGWLQLDAIAARKQQDGVEQNTFLVSSTPFGPAPRDYRLSARQSQFNWLSKTPSSIGEISTRLEANLFPIDGSTRITWNQAYLQVGEWLTFGKTYSTFMDDAAIPTTLDYNGPSGVTFVRQALLRGSLPVGERWKIEASAEDSQADFTASAAILDLRTSAKRPDLAARVRYESDSAHFQLSVLSRGLRVATTTPFGPRDRGVDGKGLSVSGSLPAFGEDSISFQLAGGEGIGRYFNDPLSATGLALSPAGGLELVRSTGATLYYQRQWAPDWMSVAGASTLRVSDEGSRPAEALKRANYASVNLVHRLSPRMLLGGEVLWGEATKVSGAAASNARLQFSFRYLMF